MKISNGVKMALLISIFLLAPLKAFSYSILPDFDCGSYLVRGTLGLNNRGSFTIKIQANTSSPYELILLGGDFDQLRSLIGLPVTAEIYVFKPVKSNNDPVVVFQKWGADLLSAEDPVFKVREGRCGGARFINSIKKKEPSPTTHK